MRDTVSAAIEPMRPSDWPHVRRIYEEGIATGRATFESAAPEWDAWDASHRPECRFVARRNGRVVGWIASSAGARRRDPYARRAAETLLDDAMSPRRPPCSTTRNIARSGRGALG